jgi:GDP-4-dehydro-6-deoxy-D-mannose reductase
MTVNVLEAARHEARDAALVLVGSGQVYGDSPQLPVTEQAPLRPGNPYAVSKAANEMLAEQYEAGFGMSVVRMRPFNHAGPGQSDEYVLATLARQVAEAEASGHAEALLRTGDVSTGRDFSDVRDVVRAYALAARAEPGAYNVCSGRATRIAELIEMLAEAATVPVRHEVDPARLRASDARELRGSYDRLAAATGWRPEIPLEQTVRDTLDWWRGRVSAGA